MSLPIVKSATKTTGINRDSLLKCIETATTLEGAQYVYDQSADSLSLTPQGKEAQSVINKYVEGIKLQTAESGQPWAGDTKLATPFQNYQQGLAASAAKMVGSRQITFGFAVSEASKYQRGYLANGEKLDKPTTKALDELFLAWLAKQNKVLKNEAIYDANPNGQITQDEYGHQVLTDAEKLRRDIMDPKEGFAQYAKQKNNAVDITSILQDYTEPKAEAAEGVEHSNPRQAT